jgi:hypothetical protein
MLAPITDPTITSVFAAKTRITEDGTVEGYASLFGEIDQARDMVVRGAFRASLAVRGPAGGGGGGGWSGWFTSPLRGWRRESADTGAAPRPGSMRAAG